MGYIDLATYGLEFKHIVSGPSPVGRILNYVIAVGKGMLNHKNGARTLELFHYKEKGIGSAWCTEFLVGLGICVYNFDAKSETPLFLTNDGKSLFEKIKDFNGLFDENKNPSTCKNQLKAYSDEAYNLFLNIFRKSIICKNLVEYIKNLKTKQFIYSVFCEDYYKFFMKYYTGQDYVTNSGATTTASNRVPSLIQLCQFFDLAVKQSTKISFNFDELQTPEIMAHFVDKKKLQEEAEKEERKIKRIEELVEKYGEKAESLREVLARNSTVQSTFRNNLITVFGCECVICKRNLEEVLIASHIKPSKESNVIEKIDENNGLLLCANHDKLFDKYLISFNYKTGVLMYSVKLANKLQQYELTKSYSLATKYLSSERANYMLLHNLKFNEVNAI